VYEYYASRLPVESFVAPDPLDLIWIADRYHDLHNKTFGAVNVTFVNTALLKALKPGGSLIVEDYVAKQGSGARDAENLHRMDVEWVKREMATAGFEFVGESQALHNTNDRRTDNAHAIEAADRFVLKFRKP
jgi:predicted methyltransferase